MRKRLSVIAFMLLVLTGHSAAAGEDSADSVIQGCRYFVGTGEGNEMEQGFCTGAVTAIVEVSPDICAPSDVTTWQAVGVVVKYIDDQPVRLHEPFNKLALEALRRAWSCP